MQGRADLEARLALSGFNLVDEPVPNEDIQGAVDRVQRNHGEIFKQALVKHLRGRMVIGRRQFPEYFQSLVCEPEPGTSAGFLEGDNFSCLSPIGFPSFPS